jgi:hypothetical protein
LKTNILELKNLRELEVYVKIICCGLIMGLFVYFIKNLDFGGEFIQLLCAVVSSAVLYFILLYLTKGISGEDISLLKSAF